MRKDTREHGSALELDLLVKKVRIRAISLSQIPSLRYFKKQLKRITTMDFWTVGNRAFAYWDEDEYFYPATIVTIDGDDIFVRFDTGEEEWTNAEYLEEFIVEVDDEVECKSTQDNLYYDVTILDVDGDRVEVGYEDETSEWSTLSRLRFFVDEE